MAKAANAPNLRDTIAVEVTTHSLEKLRERLPGGSHFLSMPDADLRLRLEDAWKDARRRGLVEEWWERVEDEVRCNFVVDLSDAFSVELVGLYRENDRRAGQPVLITVLTRQMAEANKTANKWARSPDKIGVKELLATPMREALGAVQLPDPPTPEPPKPVRSRPTPRAVPMPESDTELLRKVLVTFRHPETGDELHQVTTKAAVQGLVNELVSQGVDESSIDFWFKTSAKIKKTVTVEF